MSELRLDLLFQLDIGSVLGKEFLDIGATVECRFTQKCARDMVITYSQIYWGLSISFEATLHVFKLSVSDKIKLSKLYYPSDSYISYIKLNTRFLDLNVYEML